MSFIIKTLVVLLATSLGAFLLNKIKMAPGTPCLVKMGATAGLLLLALRR